MTNTEIQKKRKLRIQTLTLIFLILSPTLTNKACQVDQCKRCKDKKLDTCDECEDGYYLRTFYGKDKGREYNACWSIFKLVWFLIGLALLLLSYCLCCYVAWKLGQKSIKSLEAPTVSAKHREPYLEPPVSTRRELKEMEQYSSPRRAEIEPKYEGKIVRRNAPIRRDAGGSVIRQNTGPISPQGAVRRGPATPVRRFVNGASPQRRVMASPNGFGNAAGIRRVG